MPSYPQTEVADASNETVCHVTGSKRTRRRVWGVLATCTLCELGHEETANPDGENFHSITVPRSLKCQGHDNPGLARESREK